MKKKPSQHPIAQTVLARVESSLQEQFKGVTQKELAAAFFEVEKKKSDWLCKAIIFGMAALAMKPQIGHGKFESWLQKAINGEGRSLESAKRYMRLAIRISEQIAMPFGNNEVGARVIAYMKERKIKPDALPAILKDGKKTIDILAYIVDGFSLRSLTKALHSVDIELALEDRAAKAGPKEIPEDKIEVIQLSFEQELFAPIVEIQRLVCRDSFASLPKEKALQFADALIAEGTMLKKKLTGKK